MWLEGGNFDVNLIKCDAIGGLPLITYAPRGEGGSSLLYISIAYHMQKGGGWLQIACKIAYVLNGRPLTVKEKKKCWL